VVSDGFQFIVFPGFEIVPEDFQRIRRLPPSVAAEPAIDTMLQSHVTPVPSRYGELPVLGSDGGSNWMADVVAKLKRPQGSLDPVVLVAFSLIAFNWLHSCLYLEI